LGAGTFCGKFRGASQIAVGARRQRAVAGEISLGLADLRFKRAAVQGYEQVALFDVGAVVKMNTDDLVVDPCLDGDARHCRHGAECINHDRRVLPDRGCDIDQHRTRGRPARRGSGRRTIAGDPFDGREPFGAFVRLAQQPGGPARSGKHRNHPK
jgi:hypothetical protein